MSTSEAPVLVTVSETDLLWPTCTLPKLMLKGFGDNVPGPTPTPDKGTFSVGFDASEVMARFPLSLPDESGANTTLKLTLCPAVRVSGGLIPLMLKPVPVALT